MILDDRTHLCPHCQQTRHAAQIVGGRSFCPACGEPYPEEDVDALLKEAQEWVANEFVRRMSARLDAAFYRGGRP
jgi:hypothetical protein